MHDSTLDEGTGLLTGKVGLVAGLANEQSIAFGCAEVMRAAGAELVCAYGHPKSERFITPHAERLGSPPLVLLDVRDEAQMDAVFELVAERFGRLDFLVHSIAFARMPDLHGRLTDASLEAFNEAMDISCHSFVRMARRAEPLMQAGGTLITMSYLGAQRAVRDYALMGPVKAALESSVRYLARELGPTGIRVHAISPGPIATRAGSGLKGFDTLIAHAETSAALGRGVTTSEVGALAAFLASDGAAGMTGATHFVDAGHFMMDGLPPGTDADAVDP